MYKKALSGILAGLVLGAIPSMANAAWNNGLTPGSIRYSGKAGYVTFVPTGATIVSGCSNADFYIIIPSNNPGPALAMLLSAALSGRNVSIYVPDDSTKCDPVTGRPTFTDIQLN